MKKMNKVWTILLGAWVTTIFLSACNNADVSVEKESSGSSAEQVSPKGAAGGNVDFESTELVFVFADGDEAFKTAINHIVDDFNAAYSNIHITIQPGDGGSYSELLKTKDSVGEFPDMMEMRDTARYVRAGKLAPISEELIPLFKTTMEFDGVTYTAPYAGENTNGILYNKAYFDEQGLKIPDTWDDFLALCQQIQDLGDMSPLVVGGQDLWHLGFWYSKIYKDDVLIDRPDFIADCYAGTADFRDERMVQTFEDMKELFQYAQDGWASTPDAQITTFLVNDMSAMMFSGTHMISQIYEADPEFNLGWFAVPDRKGRYHLVGGAGVTGLALSAEANAEKQAAFEEFIKFFFAKENYKGFLETMNYLPTTVDVPKVEGGAVYQAVLEAVNAADGLSPMWNGLSGENEIPADFRNFTYKTLVEVIQGSRTVDSALDEMQKTWDVAAKSFNPVTGVGLE